MEQNQKEKLTLAPYATFSAQATRDMPEEEKLYRTDFQRDRDKIIHSDAFRRLKDKTQVFLNSNNDHNRTRLTHTLEVSQVARVIARALDLNEDLTESIALGHDLGHSPFGHAGEDVINELASEGFKHAEHSVRVTQLENLNLTHQVKDGIISHTGDNKASTLEGQIVKYADRIAYINHDIQDSIREGVLQFSDLPRDCMEVLGETHSQRINTLVCSIIEESQGKPIVMMCEQIEEKMLKLRKFLFDNVYNKMTERVIEARKIISKLFAHYQNEGWNEQRIIDHVAGMTDNYAVRKYESLN